MDVGNLADCLVGIHQNLADDTILDRYSEVRRQKYSEVVNPASSANIKRLWQDPEAADQDEFFQLLGKAKKDPAITKRLQDVCLSTLCGMRLLTAYIRASTVSCTISGRNIG